MRQLEGRKSRCNDPTMSMKRSSHMPTWTRHATAKSVQALDRSRRDQSTWIERQLQKMTDQKTQAYAPKGRSTSSAYSSYVLPPYHAMNGSTAYVYVTIHPVTRSILPMLSRWFFVMTFSRRKIRRTGTRSCRTIAKPE